MNLSYHFYKTALAGRSLPLAFVNLDLFDENVRAIASRTGSKKLRVASKSVRCVALLKRILAANPIYQGIMSYSGFEAVYLSRQGLDDLLVAYPIFGETQVEAVCAEVKSGKKIVLMLDSPEAVHQFSSVAKKCGVILSVALDIDMSSDFPGLHFGVRRSPITTPEQTVALYKKIQSEGHLHLDGIMGYEAQIAGVQDAVPGGGLKNALIRKLKQSSIKELRKRRAEIVKALEAEGAKLRIVNGGGTGSLESTREEDCVTETTAGSGFYSPGLFDHFSNFKHQPSAGFAIEIVRRPTPDIFTCHGGGYIASGPPAKDRLPIPFLPEGCELLPLEGAGEVQTPIVYRGSEKLSIGDPIFMRHAKAGELCERFKTLLLISNGKVVDEVTTYRGDGECFV